MGITRRWLAIAVLIMAPRAGLAQHEHADVPPPRDGETEMAMSGALIPYAPASREGSGTSWLPDDSRMAAYHFTAGEWHLMLHGNVVLGATFQNVNNAARRGENEVGSRNWAMLMAQQHPSRRTTVMLRTMLSADRLTVGGDGYPLLMQTGETWQGEPLFDRQHPHDLFAELAAGGSIQLGEAMAVFGYFGYPGEPAYGPPVFMHRPAAANLADAPLGHHWQDATHITFGVATAGITARDIKLEGSVFTGREPDEDRYGFDQMHLDSYSARLSFNPRPSLAAQASWASVQNPEALEPGVDQRKVSVSLLYQMRLAGETMLAASFIWGLIDPTEHDPQHSLLAEADLSSGPNSVFARVERVQKSTHDLALTGELGDATFAVLGFTAGVARRVVAASWGETRLGGQVTLNPPPDGLDPYYGASPLSLQVFVRISPPGQLSSRSTTIM